MTATSIITTQSALNELCDTLQHHRILFVDTEFVRERTYYPILCLIQIAGETGDAYAVDALAKDMSLAPLYELLLSNNNVKVMHSARQDMELFYQHTGQIIRPLFDTQIAAMVLGLGEQIGYSALVQHFLGNVISKAQQFTDWARRPLSDAQIAYALDDVYYLRDAYPLLCDALQKAGRDGWVQEESAHLYDPALYVPNPDDAWKRIRKRDHKPHYLARLQQLAAWREHQAIAENVPRGSVVSDDMIQEMALTNTRTESAVSRVRGFNRKSRYTQEVLDVIATANALPKESCPVVERRKSLSKQQELTRDVLKLLLKAKATEHNMSPSLLCSSDDLLPLMQGDDAILAMHGWRHELFGKDAVALLKGKLSISVHNGAIQFS